MALLLLALAALPGRIEAATIDHRLREESKSEAEMVARECASLSIPHAIVPVDLAKGNVHAKAREARYAALKGWAQKRGMRAVATAHHADDQAETLLMRLNRGSGLAGLAAVRPRVDMSGLAVVRPLLEWRKADLVTLCEAARQRFVLDPSNEITSFDRVRIRKAMAEADWIDPAAVARSAAHLSQADALIERLARLDWAKAVQCNGAAIRYRPHGEQMVAIETMAHIYEHFGAHPSRSECAEAYGRLQGGENASLGGVLAVASTTSGGAAEWHFSPEPPRRPA